MIEKLNSKIRPLLDIHEKLKDVLTLAKIKTPRIATCGMQSHGKSSTLESITKIELPAKAETCTICPIKICLRETKGKEYYKIKFEGDQDDGKEFNNFKKLKNKIDEFQEKVKKKYELKDQKITKETVIQVNVYKNNVPNLDLYDLPGVTFVEGIKEEAEEIYDSFLNDENTTVLLILNGGDDLTNSSVTEWMKKVNNYKNRFIPVIAKSDLITNFEGKFKQLQKFELNTKPCLIINKFKDGENMKNLSDAAEVAKIKSLIPKAESYPINIGRKKLINELIKIQYEKYKENYKDMVKNINNEIKKNKEKLAKLPRDFDLKEDFCDSFIDIFENLLKKFTDKIKEFKKGPEGKLLKYEIHVQYKDYITLSKEKVNDFLTIEFCNYVTNNIKMTNIDQITILEDKIPFQLLITPKIKEILKIFEEVINNIYRLIKEKIGLTINSSFGEFLNLKDKINDIYDDYSEFQYKNMKKIYDEICLLETNNITSFDLELNYKCHVLVRKILNFLYKKENKNEEEVNKKEDDKKEENQLISKNNENNEITDNNENNILENKKEDEEKIEKEDEDEDTTVTEDTSDNIICDERDDIISGVKNINNLIIKAFQKLTKETINKLTKEVKHNPNYKKNVKDKYKEYKNDIMQIIGIINNYEIEQLTRIYDSIGCKGRPKLAYNPESITTFDERLEDIIIDGKDGYEFIPGFQFIKKDKLNDFINFFKSGKVEQKTANTIVKMVAYAEVMCNRVIDILFLSIQNYLYDSLTNIKMVNFLRNEVHKSLFKLNFDECKKLLEVNAEIAEEIKTRKNNINKLTSALKEIEKVHAKFYEKDVNEDEEDYNKINEEDEKKEDNEQKNDEDNDSNNEDDKNNKKESKNKDDNNSDIEE